MSRVNEQPAHTSLAERGTRGLAWVTAATLLSKVVNAFGQIALAWFLLPRDFGAVGMAYSVMAFVSVLEQAGSSEVLLSRPKRFDRWLRVAFWMNLVIGLGAMVLLMTLAPVATWVYGEPIVGELLLVLALATPLSAVSAVPTAKLRLAMRFRAIATVQVIAGFGRTGMAIGLAAAEFGAFSFVIPAPIVQVVVLLVLWRLAKPPITRRLELRRWRYLIGDSLMLVLSRGLNTVLWQVDYMILGLFHPKSVVGQYFFGFNLSIQSLRLFAGNFAQVMLPSLANVTGGPAQQTAMFIKAVRLLAVVALPMSMLQAILADPLIRLVFDERWYAAIPMLQALSVGMAFRLIGSPAGTLMQAHRRYRSILGLQSVYSTSFITIITLAAWLGDGLTVALSAAAFFSVLGPFHLWFAITGRGGSWRDLLLIFGWPTLLSVVASSGSMAVGRLVPDGRTGLLFAEAVAMAVAFAVLYMVPAAALMPWARRQIITRSKALISRRKAAPAELDERG